MRKDKKRNPVPRWEFLKKKTKRSRPTDSFHNWFVDSLRLFSPFYPFAKIPGSDGPNSPRQFPRVSIMTDIISPAKSPAATGSRSSPSFLSLSLCVCVFFLLVVCRVVASLYVSQVKVTGHKFTRPGNSLARIEIERELYVQRSAAARKRINTLTHFTAFDSPAFCWLRGDEQSV
jgi:hypothetical protein